MLDLGARAIRRLHWAGAGTAVSASVLLAAVTLTVGIPVDPEGGLVGSPISTFIQVTVAAVIGVAGIASLRWRAAPALVMAVAVAGLGAFASIQYTRIVTVAVLTMMLIPALALWLSWQVRQTPGAVGVLAAVTGVLVAATVAGALAIQDHYQGPTHPDSVATTAFAQADWLWLGGVTDRSATIVGGGFDQGDETALLLGEPWAPDRRAVTVADRYGLVRFDLDGLAPDTRYPYTLVAVGSEVPERPDAVFTTPSRAGPRDLVVAFGSCARTGSNGAVYDAIWAADPDLFVVTGDLHYGNLESTDPADHVVQYRRALEHPGPARVFSSIPTAYVWDDHDYGPNNADGSSPSRTAVSLAYRAAVPSHGVSPDPADPINQAFTIGDVRFVVVDTRSFRSADSMLGETQRRWLVEEILTASARYELVVWVNPTPWISRDGLESDNWSAYPAERAAISDALAGVDNLVMVSGDAHMVAIDDGTNSGYGTDATWGFPVLQAAALDRPGSIKGGPYSEGAYPGGGQFGLLEVRHTTDGLVVRLSGRTWDGRELVSFTFSPRS